MSYSVEHQFFGPTSYRKARPASGSSSGFHSQRRRLTYSQPPSVDSLDTFNGNMTRKSEKELLQVLNDRFASYIDKVRNLEMHNHNLEDEAALLRQNQTGRSSIREHYERELSNLKGLLQELTGEKAIAAMEHEHLEEDLQHLRGRLEDEARNREELEAAARAMQKYVEECRLARLELEKKLGALEQEEVFLKKNHDEEVAELLAQIQSAQVTFGMRDTLKADLTGALREIRAQLDNHASRSSAHAEDWFQVRVERLSNAAKCNQDAIRGTQQEISEYRRQLQSCTIELETVRATKESLERQCLETADKHQDDLKSLQETINQLDNELKTTKWEMASQLKDYQELLNVKMALDIEIAAYRKLLEGEENRFVSGGCPYSYLQRRISGHFKVKGDEISDTVIVEEQTEETQVTEVTEEADEEEEEEEQQIDEEEAGAEEEEEETGEEVVVKEKVEKKGENEEIVKEKTPDKDASPPSKSPAIISPESKSPMVKSPAKSPAVKSPTGDESKSPLSKSQPSKSPESKTPETKFPVKEKPKPVAANDTSKEEKQDKPRPVEKETKENEKTMEEKKQEPREEETITDKPDIKKDSKADEAAKTIETPKPAALSKPTDDKPAPESGPKDSAPPPAEMKPSATKPEKVEPEAKSSPKAELEKTESKKEEVKKPVEKSTPKAESESTENKKEEKIESSTDGSKEVREGGKADKPEKSSVTESKESKEEKAKK